GAGAGVDAAQRGGPRAAGGEGQRVRRPVADEAARAAGGGGAGPRLPDVRHRVQLHHRRGARRHGRQGDGRATGRFTVVCNEVTQDTLASLLLVGRGRAVNPFCPKNIFVGPIERRVAPRILVPEIDTAVGGSRMTPPDYVTVRGAGRVRGNRRVGR